LLGKSRATRHTRLSDWKKIKSIHAHASVYKTRVQ
jgi:hypothetical protein